MKFQCRTLAIACIFLVATSCSRNASDDDIFTFPARHPVFQRVSIEGAITGWFKNNKEGVALRYIGNSVNDTRISKTVDSGLNWTTVLEIPGQGPKELEFVSGSPVGYFTTYQALYRSDDYGNSWTKVLETPSAFVNLGELCVIDDNTLLLGFDGQLNKSTDGGQHWQPFKTFLPNGNYLTSILFLNENQGYIGYKDGTVERTLDGGQHWETFDTGFMDEVTRFFFRDSQNGYASCFYRDYIAVTTDGGQTWTKGNPTDRLSGFMQMWFDDSGNGLLTARGNKVFYTTDYGKNCYLFLNAPGLGDERGFIQVTGDGTIWTGFSNALYQIILP